MKNFELLSYLPIIAGWLSALTGLFLTVGIKRKPRNMFDHYFIYGAASGVAILLSLSYFIAYLFPEVEIKILDAHQIIASTSYYLNLSILILSFAYLAYSLDQSGFFEYCANLIIIKWGKSKWSIYFALYLLVSILTFVTSNDIVILSMTPIIIYIGRRLEIKDMVPYLLMGYFTANILSMGLYIGSPTNVVIADKMEWSFIEYAKNMLIPTIAALFSGVFILSVIFYKRINSENSIFKLSSRLKYITVFDKEMGIKVFIFITLLITLSSMDLFYIIADVDIWKVCLLFAILNLIYDLYQARCREKIFGDKNDMDIVKGYLNKSLINMPWTIFPFLISMGILVTALTNTGLTQVYLDYLLSCININNDSNLFDYIKSSVIFSVSSGILVNIMNDIPSSLFIAESLQHLPSYIDENQRNMLTVSALIGVNPGVGFTIAGALAGLMWMGILQKYEHEEDQYPNIREITVYGLPSMMFVIIFTSTISAIFFYYR